MLGDTPWPPPAPRNPNFTCVNTTTSLWPNASQAHSAERDAWPFPAFPTFHLLGLPGRQGPAHQMCRGPSARSRQQLRMAGPNPGSEERNTQDSARDPRAWDVPPPRTLGARPGPAAEPALHTRQPALCPGSRAAFRSCLRTFPWGSWGSWGSSRSRHPGHRVSGQRPTRVHRRTHGPIAVGPPERGLRPAGLSQHVSRAPRPWHVTSWHKKANCWKREDTRLKSKFSSLESPA